LAPRSPNPKPSKPDTVPAPPALLAGEDLPPEPKQERSRRARAALLNATLALFAERGFEATSVEEIASAAGVAVGGFYQHFRSKRQALLVLMDRLIGELSALEVALPESAPPRAIVGAIVHAALYIDWAYLGAYRAWREVILHDAEVAAHNRALEAWTMSRLRMLAALLLSLPGARTDVDVEAFCWVSNQLFWRLTEAAAVDREGVERTVTAFFWHALFAD
jgi:AcrR family transcriptional regulator